MTRSGEGQGLIFYGSMVMPFVDQFGQYGHGQWKYKVKSYGELRADLADELGKLQAAPSSWDEYGGWANGPQLEATGSFRTEKVGGKWWFVTPSGHLFYSIGIKSIYATKYVNNATLNN